MLKSETSAERISPFFQLVLFVTSGELQINPKLHFQSASSSSQEPACIFGQFYLGERNFIQPAFANHLRAGSITGQKRRPPMSGGLPLEMARCAGAAWPWPRRAPAAARIEATQAGPKATGAVREIGAGRNSAPWYGRPRPPARPAHPGWRHPAGDDIVRVRPLPVPGRGRDHGRDAERQGSRLRLAETGKPWRVGRVMEQARPARRGVRADETRGHFRSQNHRGRHA